LRLLRRRVEGLPCRLDEVREALALGRGRRAVILLLDLVGHPEVGPAAALELADDVDVDLVGVERLAGGAGDRRVARGVGDERLDGRVLRLAGSAPTRPVDRGRERLLRAGLDRDVDLHALRPVAAASSDTRRAIRSTSVPSSPSASTSADATITPPAPA